MQINVLAKLSEILKYEEPSSFYEFPKTFNTIQIGTVWRQIDKIDPNCLWPVFLNEFAPLVLGIIKKQIDEETGILVSKFVNQFDKPLVAVM